MTYELGTVSVHDLDNVTGANGRFDYMMQQKPQTQTHAPAQRSSGPNFLQQWGGNVQKAGEYEVMAGGAGTITPVVGETGIPESLVAGGSATWLLGKGMSAIGGLFHH